MLRSQLATVVLAATFIGSVWLHAQKIDRIYVFGDSYSDIGRGWLDSDGPTAIAVLAKRLNLTMVASDKPHAETDSLDFAVSGAATGQNPGHTVAKGWLGLGMKNQVEDFTAMTRSGLHFPPSSTLFFLAGGLNDRRISTEETIDNLRSEIDSLYAVGARRFAIALLPEKIPAYSEVGIRLNPALRSIPIDARARHPDMLIKNSDWGPDFDFVLDHATQFGLTNTTNQCAGRAIFDEDPTPCASPVSHFYYHRNHPSALVHKLVGERLLEELTSPAAKH
jgi:hypothetical protein